MTKIRRKTYVMATLTHYLLILVRSNSFLRTTFYTVLTVCVKTSCADQMTRPCRRYNRDTRLETDKNGNVKTGMLWLHGRKMLKEMHAFKSLPIIGACTHLSNSPSVRKTASIRVSWKIISSDMVTGICTWMMMRGRRKKIHTDIKMR